MASNVAKKGKRLKAAYAGVDADRLHPLEEAIRLVKTGATAKFDETVEIALNLGVDPRHADQMVRGVVGLPNGTGKTVRIGVFGRGGRGRRRGPRGRGAGRQDRLRPLHRHAGHDGAGRAAG
jgi:large subunit ribosomal protein L1